MNINGVRVGMLVLLLAGCRHAGPAAPTGRSAFTFVEPPPAPPPKAGSPEANEPVSSAQYREATPLGPLALPVYPARALAARAGVATVGVRVTVDTQGRATDVRPSLLSLSTPGPYADDFRAAVETALRQWKFAPARTQYFETVEEKGVTYNRLTRTELLEAEFDLAFTFTAEGGVLGGPKPK